MASLIDTNVAIHFRDRDRRVTDLLISLDQFPKLSILSLVELEGGVYRQPALASARRRLLDAMLGQFELLELDAAVISAYGAIIAAAGFSRRRIIDRLIAATALVHDLTLITMNEADFRDVPSLRLEVWGQ